MKQRIYAKWIFALAVLGLSQPLLANPQTMVHVHYKGTIKVSYDGLSTVDVLKKTCDDMRKNYPSQSIPPFKLFGNPKDLESYTEDVYILPENAYHATYKSGYKIDGSKKVMCEVRIVPYQEKTMLDYKQRSSYKFDSSLPEGQQWFKSTLLGQKTGKSLAKSMMGLWGFNVRRTGKTDKIAGLFCDVAELSTSKADFKSTSCVWRAKAEDKLKFLGYPLELMLRSQTQMGKGAIGETVADSVNLREAYAPDIFQAPKKSEVTSLDALAGDDDDDGGDASDTECLAEKKKTGFNPCAGSAEAAKWCKFELKRTGVDPCVEHEDDDTQ